MNFRHWVYSTTGALCLILTGGCHSSASGGGAETTPGSNDTINVTPSVSGTIGAVAGAGARTVAISFNTSDGKPIASLRITSNLAELPSGWSAPPGTFTCASVSTGNGCILNLTFAPTGDANGTLSLEYSYTDNAGTAKTGSLSIPYSGTVHDNVAGTASPSGQVSVLVGATHAVNVNFTTDDGNPATALTLTTALSSLPSGWSSSASSFSCAKISTGNGCQLALSFAPSGVESGTLGLRYSYTDNAGTAKTGSLSIPYSGTTHNNVAAAVSPSGQVGVIIGASETLNVNFTTDDGNPATALTLTAPLSSLPSGWSSSASSFTCATISTGNGCQLPLSFAPSSVSTGTLTLNYGYTDNAGTAQTGSVSIAYTATTHDNVVATASPSGQVSVLVSASQAVSVNFTTDDGNAATALTLTTLLSSLPSDWSSSASSFTCATISTGNGCQLPISFAPSTVSTGTLTLNYGYMDNAGTAQTGSVSIPYAGTTHNNVDTAVSPSGQVGALVGATQAVSVNFTTDDGNPATALTLSLSGLPSDWSSSSVSFSCATISTGNGCQLALSYAPGAVENGTLSLSYSYTDNAGTAQTGSVSIPYAATTHDTVVATASPSGQVSVLVSASQAVNVNFTTNDGNPATLLTLTTSLNSLPSDWSSSASSFSCATISTGNGCQLALSFAPSAVESGTLTLQYSYTDNAGTAQTGSVSIPYTATTHNNVVATASPSGTVTVNLNATQAVSVIFTSDDGNPVSALAVTSGLTTLPAGWSSSSSSFSCASVTTGSGCTLNLSFAPSSVSSGTLTLNYGYDDNAGAAQTGSVSIPYTAASVHAYVSDVGNGVLMCSIGTGGALSNCASAGSGVSSPVATLFSGSIAFVSTSNTAVYSCAVRSDGSLSSCASAASGFQWPGNLTINGGYLYIPNLNAFGGPTACVIGSGGSLSSCTSTNAVTSQNQAAAVAFTNGFAYVATVGDRSLPGILLCTPGSGGTLSACTDSGSGLTSANSILVAGNKIYVAARAQVYLCTAGVSGALSCTVQSTSLGSGYSAARGAISIYNGFAYIAYNISNFNPTTGLFSSSVGVEACSVGVDGTLSNCATTGSGFSNPFAVTIQ